MTAGLESHSAETQPSKKPVLLEVPRRRCFIPSIRSWLKALWCFTDYVIKDENVSIFFKEVG
jgi:hypothetical protein